MPPHEFKKEKSPNEQFCKDCILCIGHLSYLFGNELHQLVDDTSEV